MGHLSFKPGHDAKFAFLKASSSKSKSACAAAIRCFVFPEGTFYAGQAGVRPFQLGAFRGGGGDGAARR